jgi:hypothetical protein
MQLPKWLIVLVAVAAVAVIWQVARANGVGQTCAVNGFGTRLCGSDLRAWCDATDPLRDQAQQLGVSDNASVDRARATCASVR